MQMYDIIKKKRDGAALTKEEIDFFVSGYTTGAVPDYQMAALLMAVYYRGMTAEETAALTFAIRDSGDVVDLSDIEGPVVDKHSSGGVGDKTTLVVAPIVAACGVKVAKMSGRGLGHTGGTIDKLESIAGFRTTIDRRRFAAIVNDVGLAVIGQSGNLAPADKKIYALRDVTATVDSLPLIVSSIMGKKLASGASAIVLDVKAGSGAFMKTTDDATALARQMVTVGKMAGKKVVALITDMDKPLGRAIGNSLEVEEAVRTLDGDGPRDLIELCLSLAANMLYLAGKGDLSQCHALAAEALSSGAAKDKFVAMVAAQGGDVGYLDGTKPFPEAAYNTVVTAPHSGYIARVDAEAYGLAAKVLGAGRSVKDEPIDLAAGILLDAKTGDYVSAGAPIAHLYTDKPSSLAEAAAIIQAATVIAPDAPTSTSVVLARVE